jgi:hypothetical protein
VRRCCWLILYSELYLLYPDIKKVQLLMDLVDNKLATQGQASPFALPFSLRELERVKNDLATSETAVETLSNIDKVRF